MLYKRDFLTCKEADDWLRWLCEAGNVSWRQESFRIFGRDVMAPRRLAWCGDRGLNYRYTGIDHPAEGWPSELAALRERITQESLLAFEEVVQEARRRGRDEDEDSDLDLLGDGQAPLPPSPFVSDAADFMADTGG